VDAICDKAFIIACWIALFQDIPSASYFVIPQYLVLLALILAETFSSCIRFATFYMASGMPAPIVEGYDLSDSKVTADHVEKAKQTFEMVGTALFMLSFTKYIGLLLLMGAVPLAYESVRRKLVRRIVYVLHASDTLDHTVLKFWMQIAAISSSSLVVGVPSNKSSDAVRNACAVACVDQVIAEAPAAKVDSAFLDAHRIDFVVLAPQQTKFFTEDVVQSNRVLAMGEDGILRPIYAKVEGKRE
jgi:phosphatidylglycerophosphate synthase